MYAILSARSLSVKFWQYDNFLSLCLCPFQANLEVFLLV